MSVITEDKLEPSENVRCGTIYLTDSGCLTYECSLCDKHYECHNDYWTHVMNEHYLTRPDVVFSAEDLQEIEEDEYNSSNTPVIEESDEENPAAEEEVTINTEEEESDVMTEMIETLDADETASYIVEKLDDDDDVICSPIEKDCSDPVEKVNVSPAPENKSNGALTTKSTSTIQLAKCTKLLREELLRKAKNIKCPKCDKISKNMTSLRVHIRRHLGILRYFCDICDKGFIGKTELNLHLRRHKNEKPFLCYECGVAFFSSGALTEHIKRRHTDVRNFSCTECNWAFKTKAMLVNHMVKHTKEKKFKCSICGAEFPRRTSWRVHMKIHANKREYACDLCEASFNQKAGLYSHKKAKHKTV